LKEVAAKEQTDEMQPWWITLVGRQRAAQFEAISGTTASLVVPVSDRLISDVLFHQLSGSIRELDIEAQSENRLTVALRLQRPAWLPLLNIKLVIDQQPRLPDAPVLVLRLLSPGPLAALAGPAAKFLTAVPSWLAIDGDLLRVDLAELLREYDAADALVYIRRLNMTTRKGAIVLAVDAEIP
jgi:hypothetical protein